jgi:hypothetical protein
MTTPGRCRGVTASGGSGDSSTGATAGSGATGGSARGGGRVGVGSARAGGAQAPVATVGDAIDVAIDVGVPRLRSAADAASLRSG